LHLRDEIRQHNTQLADAARNAGVVEPIDYAIFQNHDYMGLYNSLKMADIHKRKELKSSQKILDHMGSSELAANYFRATQTEDKLRRENIKGKAAANAAHFTVGREVRATIKKLGGTMPEDLPTADSIKKLEAKRKSSFPSRPHRKPCLTVPKSRMSNNAIFGNDIEHLLQSGSQLGKLISEIRKEIDQRKYSRGEDLVDFDFVKAKCKKDF